MRATASLQRVRDLGEETEQVLAAGSRNEAEDVIGGRVFLAAEDGERRNSIVPSGPCPPPEDTPGASPAVTTSQVAASIHDFAGSGSRAAVEAFRRSGPVRRAERRDARGFGGRVRRHGRALADLTADVTLSARPCAGAARPRGPGGGRQDAQDAPQRREDLRAVLADTSRSRASAAVTVVTTTVRMDAERPRDCTTRSASSHSNAPIAATAYTRPYSRLRLAACRTARTWS